MMRFTVASHHTHDEAFWLACPYAYTTMTTPPDWARPDAHNRNLDLFTPPGSIVWDIKAGRIDDDEYTRRYWDALRGKWGAIKTWVASHADDHVILLCACRDSQFCHRWLIRELLLKMGCEEVPLTDEESEPMDDIVVTVPKSFGMDTWIGEGDPAGDTWSGEEWHFYLGEVKPNVKPGARVYVTYNGILRGYAPLVRVEWVPARSAWALVRHGGAVAVTIDEPIPGFRGFHARWWNRDQERSFDAPWYDGRPQWQVAMEWERRECVPNHPSFPANVTHRSALLLDNVPISGYYRLGKSWGCTRCGATFQNAADVQAHIKANELHIKHAVEYFMAHKRSAA